MKTFTFAVLTDSHVRLEKGGRHDFYPSDQFANARNRYVVQKIKQLAPDLVIHLGDIVHPIPALPTHETAVQVARDLYQDLSKLYVAPGNHDVGDKPNAWVPAPGVDEKSHEIFERYWGPSYLSFDYPDDHQGCHFVLINSLVLNSGLRREKDQREWLERDLAANQKTGKRVFLFTHYPLYLNYSSEEEHYDNVAEPARSWLLSLLEKYDVEAVFAGHVHNFFYNRYLNTDLYTLPSITFVRPDFSELFHVPPAAEYGRNDAAKLGFFLVSVDSKGHNVEPIRTHGLTGEREETVVACPISLSGDLAETGAAPVGVSLRHAWAESIEMPCDNLDEFTRKPARNDYLLQASWELDIRKLRVPLGDVANDETRERMHLLQSRGYEFTVFSAGAPNRRTQEMIVRCHHLIAAWEVTAPWDQMPEAIRGIRDVKQKAVVQTYLSKIDTLADQRHGREFRFSHFASHGFKLDEHDLLATCVTKHNAAQVIDGFVFRLTPGIPLWQGIRTAERFAADFDLSAVAHVQLPRQGEGVAYADDHEISNRVAETLAVALAAKDVAVFLDTFVDHDRGYYPRNGLLDRRYNPRPGYYVFRHLQRALGSDQHTLEMTPIDASASIRAFALETGRYRSVRYRCALLLTDEKVDHVELDIPWLSESGDRDGAGQWMDLQTGKTRQVRWEPSSTDSGQIVLDTIGRFAPALLIFDASSGQTNTPSSQ